MPGKEGLRGSGLIVIAGASGAGKSCLARRMERELAFPHYELDRLFNLLKQPFDRMAIESEDVRKRYRSDVTAALVPEILGSFVKLNVRAIVEGGWLSPKDVASLMHQYSGLACLFLGYGGSGESRLKQFQRGTTHWSSGKELTADEHRKVVEFFDKQIRKSVELRTECDVLGLKYIDTTEEHGFETAFRYLRSEVEKTE